jgi:peptidylprolyl isomerase
MARPLVTFLMLGGLAFGLAGCGQSRPTPVDPSAYRPIGSTGVKYAVLRPGTGIEAREKVRVTVHYTGWLQSSGQKFESSFDAGRPFDFIPGYDDVLRGWNVGLPGMKVGEKRQLVIPPAMGYGSHGMPPAIPPNATLIFEVELLKVG